MNRAQTFLEQKKKPTRKKLETTVKLTREQMDKMCKLSWEYELSVPDLIRASVEYFLAEIEKPL